jgi:hypothetical protein
VSTSDGRQRSKIRSAGDLLAACFLLWAINCPQVSFIIFVSLLSRVISLCWRDSFDRFYPEQVVEVITDDIRYFCMVLDTQDTQDGLLVTVDYLGGSRFLCLFPSLVNWEFCLLAKRIECDSVSLHSIPIHSFRANNRPTGEWLILQKSDNASSHLS